MFKKGHLPKWYYYRAGKSDLNLIMVAMRYIPVKDRQKVAEEYERIYAKDGLRFVGENRRLANKYLVDLAKQYGFDPERKAKTEIKKVFTNEAGEEFKAETQEFLNLIQKRINLVKKPKSIIDMAEQSHKQQGVCYE